jgi:reactive intermediate/imine deaminase
MVKTVLLACIVIAAAAGADRRVIVPPAGPKPVGPYSPGILVGDYFYVSGQGSRTPDGRELGSFEERARQCLENVKAIVEAAGLTMEHVVYAHLYLDNLANLGVADRVWRTYFGKNPPARAVVGVKRMPTDTPIEITVVAVRDLAHKKVVELPRGEGRAVLTHDRLYLASVHGRDLATGKPPADPAEEVRTALERAEKVLKAAGLSLAHMVFINPYLTAAMPMEVMNKVYARYFEFGNTPARATLRMNELPDGSNFELTGVAVRNLAERRAVRPKNMAPSATASPCVFAGDTLFCSAKSGFIPGPNSGIWAPDVELQVRQSMRNLLDGLEEAGMDFSHVVAANVYVDDLNEFSKMNAVYGSYFTSAPPTRTTVQPLAPVERKPDEKGRWPMLEQISLIAVK